MGVDPQVIILLLILALIVLWAVVLGPSILERRKGSPANSIVAFNNRLGVLASTQSPLPQQRPGQAVIPQQRPPTGFSSGPGSTVTLITSDGRPADIQPSARSSFPPGSTANAASPVAGTMLGSGNQLGAQASSLSRGIPVRSKVGAGPAGVSAQQLRRKQVLMGLLGVAGFTFVVGLLPGMRVVLAISLVFIGLLGGYVYLLLQWKQNEQERSRKVRHLRAAEVQGPAGVIIDGQDESELRLVAGDSRQ